MNVEKQFIQCFRKIAPQYRRIEVFSDFIILAALDMYQAVYRSETDETLKARFQSTKSRYSKEEFVKLSQLLALTVEALTERRYDFLGNVFMQLELIDEDKGQYFTAQHIADLMAKVTLKGCESRIKQQGFITLCEPTCGSGVMVIGCANALTDAGFNPQTQLWVQCRDVDFTAAMMCYIQLSLLHIPACIIVGDSLSDERKIEICTLAHWMGDWSNKLSQKEIGNVFFQSEAEKPLSDPIQEIIELDENEVIFY